MQPLDDLRRQDRSDLGKILLKQKVIDEEELDDLLLQANNTNKDLAGVLVDMGRVTEETVAQAIAEELQLPFLHITHEMVDAEALQKYPLQTLLKYQTIAVFQEQETLLVMGIVLDEKSRRELETIFSDANTKVRFAIGTPGNIIPFLRKCAEKKETGEFAEDPGAVIFVFRHLTEAFRSGADEIHLVPDKGEFKVHYRRHGKLVEQESTSPTSALAISSRLKILAGTRVSESGVHQGNIRTELDDKRVQLRLAIVPQEEGEFITLTFDRGKRKDFFEGIVEETSAMLRELMKIPNGLVVLANPDPWEIRYLAHTLLADHIAVGQKPICVERKKTRNVEGLLQIDLEQIEEGLEIALLQRPDVLYLEEVESSLLPQLVADRLVLLAAPCANITDATQWALQHIPEILFRRLIRLVLVFARVRLLCQHCRRSVPMPDFIKKICPTLVQIQPMMAIGCKKCRNSGHRGGKFLSAHVWADDKFKQSYRNDCDIPCSRTLVEQLVDMVQFGEISVREMWPFI